MRWAVERVRRGPALAVGVAGLALAGGGGAYAATSGAGAIHACVHRGTRALYQAPCRRGDKRLSWSQVGPAGPAGPRGATGSPGPAGPTGPTGPAGPAASSFASFAPSSPVALSPAGASVPVMSLTDGSNGGPIHTSFAGRIIVNASVLLSSTSTADERVFCWIEVAPVGGSYAKVNQDSSDLMVGSSSITAVEMPLTGAVDEPAGSYNARVVCLRNGPDTVNFYQGDMTAIAAGT
jgi:hypothetical protein